MSMPKQSRTMHFCIEIDSSVPSPKHVVKRLGISHQGDRGVQWFEPGRRDGTIGWSPSFRMDRVAWLLLKAVKSRGQIVGGPGDTEASRRIVGLVLDSWRKPIGQETNFDDIVVAAGGRHPAFEDVDGIRVMLPLGTVQVKDREVPLTVNEAILVLERSASVTRLGRPSVSGRPADRPVHQRAPADGFQAAERARLPFKAWIRDNAGGLLAPCYRVREGRRHGIGRCTLLDCCSRTEGYAEVHASVGEIATSANVESAVRAEDRSEWRRHREALIAKRRDGINLSMTRFEPSLTEGYVMRVAGNPMEFVDAKAFDQLLDPSTAAGLSRAEVFYRDGALSMSGQGTTVPNILTTAIVVIIGTRESGPMLLIARRKPREDASFDPLTWSVGIGEGYKPVSTEKIPADPTFAASLTRGLSEELGLGDATLGFPVADRVRVHALALEDERLHPIFVSTADLRPLEFEQVSANWLSAPDQAEHSAIAALPLTEGVVSACLAAPEVPLELLRRADAEERLVVGEYPDHDRATILQPGANPWQQNAHIRLACALWYLQHGAETG